LFHNFRNVGFCFRLLLQQLNLHLLFTFFEQKLCFPQNLLTLFKGLINLTR
jgi:hypothetical protein